MTNIEKLESIEKNENFNLDELELAGYKIWPIIHYTLRKDINDNINLVTQINTSSIFRSLVYVKDKVLQNMRFRRNSSIEVAILESDSRKDEIYGDMYTWIAKQYINEFYIISRPNSINGSSNVKGEFSLIVPYMVYKLVRVLHLDFLRLYRNATLDSIIIKYSIPRKSIDYEILKFIIFRKYYDFLLKWLKIKFLYIYCGYNISNLALINSANENGIHTIEIQHGNFSPDDYAYHYSGRKQQNFQDYFANIFLCFNNRFLEYLCLENSYLFSKKKIVIDYPIKKIIQKYHEGYHQNDKKIRILIIPVLTWNDIYDSFLKSILYTLPKEIYEIGVRFHPSIRNDKTTKKIIDQYSNCVSFDENDWYNSIVIFDYFIGECSTTLLEAENIEKRVYLLDTEKGRKFAKQMQSGKIINTISTEIFQYYKWQITNLSDENQNLGPYEIVKRAGTK